MESPHIADKRGNARNRADQQMVRAFTGKVEGEIPFGGFSQGDLIAHLEFVKQGRNLAVRNEFEEELQEFLMGSGNNRIGAFVAFFGCDNA